MNLDMLTTELGGSGKIFALLLYSNGKTKRK